MILVTTETANQGQWLLRMADYCQADAGGLVRKVFSRKAIDIARRCVFSVFIGMGLLNSGVASCGYVRE